MVWKEREEENKKKSFQLFTNVPHLTEFYKNNLHGEYCFNRHNSNSSELLKLKLENCYLIFIFILSVVWVVFF